MEAVEAHELARVVDRDVARLERAGTLGPGWCGVARHQRQAADPAVEAVAAQDPPHAVGADDDAAPALLGERGADPPRPEARVAQGEGEDPLLDELARLVGHPRWPPLPRPEHLEAASAAPGPASGSRSRGGCRRSGTPRGRCPAPRPG